MWEYFRGLTNCNGIRLLSHPITNRISSNLLVGIGYRSSSLVNFFL